MTQTTTPQIRATAKELDLRLKTADEDRWLATRYAPKDVRTQLVSFYSLVHELERALTMSEPMIGRIRVQWWREVIDQIYSGQSVRAHDLALALKDEFETKVELKPHLDALLDSYDDVLDGIENEDKPPRIENGAHVAVCGALLIDDEYTVGSEEAIANCGRAYVSALIGNPCAMPRLELVQNAFGDIPPKYGAAVLYVALAVKYMKGKRVGALSKRWSIFKAALSGKL